jgi:hypothetical protein
MGLFGKDKSGGAGAEKDLAKIIAKRGAPGAATIVAMAATGQARAGGLAKEIEFRLRLVVAGTTYEPVVRQFMNDLSLTGLAPGEPVSVMYDRDDPAVLVVMQSPKYVFVRNPRAAFGGPAMIAVPAAGAGEGGQD